MQQYILKRLALALLTLFGVSLIVFFAVRLIPGGVVDQILGESQVIIADADEIKREVGALLEKQNAGGLSADEQARLAELRPSYDLILANENQRRLIEEQLDLDGPIWRQYVDWAGNLLQLDFGDSLRGQGSNNDRLKDFLPATLELSLLGLTISLLIALPVAVVAAVRQDSVPDYAGRTFAIGFLSIPQFWLGIIIIAFANNWFDKATPADFPQIWEDPWENIKYMLFPFGYFVPVGPAVVIGVALSGTVMRLTRAQMLEVLRQDYVRTAWAKGLRERNVVLGHAMKNALIPVITVVGLQVPILVGGSVVVETIFDVPGIGQWFYQAVGLRDYTVLQTVAILTAVIVVFSNLLVDLAYAWIDPRIKYS